MVESKLNPEALEHYSKSFSAIIVKDFFDKNPSITGQQIVDLTPIKQVNFFILKVLFSQWQEETKKFKSPLFDYNNENVKHALKTLVNTLSKNIAIERESFVPILERATHDTLTLMFEPKTFFENEIESFSEANYAASFKSISRYIKVRKEVFNKISSVLDEDNIDKGSVELDSLLHQACESSNLDNIENVVNAFNLILPMDVFESDENSEIEEVDTLDVEKEQLPDGPVEQETQHPESVEEDSSLDQEFDPVIENDDVKEETVVNVNEKFSEQSPTINEQFEAEVKTETVAEKHESEKVSELHSSINVNQRYMFLNDLFNNDVEEYNKAIGDIEECKSFDDSVEYLMQNYSRKYQWDMGSDEIKELLKVIFKKFR